MKNNYLLAALLSLTVSFKLQAQHMDNHWIIGEWQGDFKALKTDGSGVYDLFENLILRVEPTLEGNGHHANWFNSDGITYTGTSVRTYVNDSTWLNQWFNEPDKTWSDKIHYNVSEYTLTHESTGEDKFGKFEMKRVHSYNPDTKLYTYKHHRKYEGYSSWWLIDEIEMKRLK
ncbi:MAG: hypothetical protein RLO81_11390 [Fulvivirga sp.]|uniref:hypothetical protein n=1 Tax=Fulvivirga sp. TaxID=1931237 RepID=UPI0032EE9004